MDGTLMQWLHDRYYEYEAEQLQKLNPNAPETPQKLCEIFCIPYHQKDLNNLKITKHILRITKLKQETQNETIIRNVELVAFNQEELAYLLDEGITTIYLCGHIFTIPLKQKGIRYIGVNQPVVVIPSDQPVDWHQVGIELIDVRYDEKYQKLLDDKKRNLQTEQMSYQVSSYFKNHFNQRDIMESESLFHIITKNLKCGAFNIDDLNNSLYDIIHKVGLDILFDVDNLGSGLYQLLGESELRKAFDSFSYEPKSMKERL